MSPVPDARVEAPEARALAGRLAPELPVLAQGMFDFLTERIPDIGLDDELRGLTLASCSSSIEVGLSMVRHGIPASRTEAPVASLEHARAMAARGLSIDDTLRFYRLGHAFFWDMWIGVLSAEIDDPTRLAEILRQTAAFMFAFTDVISTQVSVALLAERDRRQRRITAQREEVAAALLAGETDDVAAAERTLGFALAPRHVGFVCWSEGDGADLEQAATRFAASVGAGRPLLIARGGAELVGWQALGADDEGAVELPAGVRVAVGSAGRGIDGFRRTHDEALRAQRYAQLSSAGGAITRFEDIRYLDLLTRDLPAARAFVAEELGELARPDERSATLREFLRVLLANDGNATATAAALGLHRNTARQRLTRAEELRGRPVTQHGAELRAALAVAQALGDEVLRPA